MKLSALLGAAASAASLLAMSAPAMAQMFPAVGFTEDALNGFVGPIPASNPPILVASDGEFPFDPFGAGFDTSDGIKLNGGWSPDPAFASAFAPGFWTQLPGTFTWALPFRNGVNCETIPEPVAKWDFTGGLWRPGTKSLVLVEPDGAFSDLIRVANENGMATITFVSDPVPEPAAWAMLLVGVGAIGAAMRTARRRDSMGTAVA